MEYILQNLAIVGVVSVGLWCLGIAMRSPWLLSLLLFFGGILPLFLGPTWGKFTWIVCGIVALVGTSRQWQRGRLCGIVCLLIVGSMLPRVLGWSAALQEYRELQALRPHVELNERLAKLVQPVFVSAWHASRLDVLGDAESAPISALQAVSVGNSPLQAVMLSPGPTESDYLGFFSSESRMLRSLENMHSAVEVEFQRREGFGAIRSLSMWPRKEILELPPPEVFSQPRYSPPDDTGSPLVNLDDADGLPSEAMLSELHRQSQLSFVDPRSLGLVSRRAEPGANQDLQVSSRGFQSHAFRRPPSLPVTKQQQQTWRVTEVELVSLLKERSPFVYQSEMLPNLEHMSHDEFPTRSLDSFEAAALERLQKGFDLVVDQQPQEIRVMGSLRAIRQCLDCHEVPGNALLGAFTYRLAPLKPVPPPVEKPALLSLR